MYLAESSAAVVSALAVYLMLWWRLEARLQPLQDLDRFLDRGLDHVDLLEAPRQGMVFFEYAAVFEIGGGADALQLAVGERRLEQVGGIQCAARGGAGADHGVDFVDEQDRVRIVRPAA